MLEHLGCACLLGGSLLLVVTVPLLHFNIARSLDTSLLLHFDFFQEVFSTWLLHRDIATDLSNLLGVACG